MVVNIIPLVRLPAHLQAFDYAVLPALCDHIQVGQLVTIPFRQSDIFGLVLGITKKPAQAELKNVHDIVQEIPFLSKDQLDFIVQMAVWYHVSPAQIARMCLPPLQKRKIKKIALVPFAKSRTASAAKILPPLPLYHRYTTSLEHKQELAAAISGPTLIIVPLVQLQDEVLRLLPPEIEPRTVLWHSELSPKEQFAAWEKIRAGTHTIIIGTRSAAFLPIPDLKTIIVDYEHDENHKQWDQAPRFQVKDVLQARIKMSHAQAHYMSFSPSCDSYFYIHKKQYRSGNIATIGSFFGERLKSTKIIDMQEERRAGRYTVLADAAKDALNNSSGDVFIYINRRGFAANVGCATCTSVASCIGCQLPLAYRAGTNTLRCHSCAMEQPFPLNCPRCKTPLIELRGTGIEFVEHGLKNLFANRQSHAICCIDADTATVFDPIELRPYIIIGTEAAFRFIRWPKTDTILFLDIDRQLSLPEYGASEHVWHRIAEVQYRRTPSSKFYLQTYHPGHLIFRSLREPDRFYRTELHGQQAVHYPPYQYLCRYFFGHINATVAQNQADHLYQLLVKKLTTKPRKITLRPPIAMQPRYFRGRYWYVIIAHFDPQHWQDDLVWLNQFVPSAWKVDPHPISLLSP